MEITVKSILAAAQAELGTKESPPGSNCVKYNTAFYGREVQDTSGAKYPWCAAFIWWLFQQCGAEKLLPIKTASCGQLMRAAQAAGIWVSGDYCPGDIAIYNFSGGSATDHCGLIETVYAQTVASIEGNTGIGSDSDGGEVMRRMRSKQLIVGAIRPKYVTQEEEEQQMRYQYLKDVPETFRPVIETLMNAGIIQGDGSDSDGNGDVIDLTRDQVRTLVFVYRGGGFDQKLLEANLPPAVPSKK